MIKKKEYKFWFCTGSQDLYGEEVLEHVAAHAKEIVNGLNQSGKLPVATNFWTPYPNLYTGAEAWILAGGAHHTAFSYDLTAEQMADWAELSGIEAVIIDKNTTIPALKKELKLGEVFYR